MLGNGEPWGGTALLPTPHSEDNTDIGVDGPALIVAQAAAKVSERRILFRVASLVKH